MGMDITVSESLKEKIIVAVILSCFGVIGWIVNNEIDRSKDVDNKQLAWSLSQQQEIKELQKEVAGMKAKIETIHR